MKHPTPKEDATDESKLTVDTQQLTHVPARVLENSQESLTTEPKEAYKGLKIRKETEPLPTRKPSVFQSASPNPAPAPLPKAAPAEQQSSPVFKYITMLLVVALLAGFAYYKFPQVHALILASPTPQPSLGPVSPAGTPAALSSTPKSPEAAALMQAKAAESWVSTVGIQAVLGKGRQSKIVVHEKAFVAGALVEPTLKITYEGTDGTFLYFSTPDKRVYKRVPRQGVF